jgi:hypothetical protein
MPTNQLAVLLVQLSADFLGVPDAEQKKACQYDVNGSDDKVHLRGFLEKLDLKKAHDCASSRAAIMASAAS